MYHAWIKKGYKTDGFEIIFTNSVLSFPALPLRAHTGYVEKLQTMVTKKPPLF